MTNEGEDIKKLTSRKLSDKQSEKSTHYIEHSHSTEVEYYNLLPSTFSTSSVSQHKIDDKQNNIHSTNISHHATLTPPPSPPTSEDTKKIEQKTNENGQQFKGSEISVLIKEPRRPPRACDSTDTMLASAATSIHNYYNLINFENKSNDIPVTPPPPRLPKRRPFLVTQSRSQSPPASFSFGGNASQNTCHSIVNNSDRNNEPSSYPLEEEFQHQAVENGFSSNFAGSRVGIQGGPPPLRRMSTGSRASFTSSVTSTTVFNNNNDITHSMVNGNYHSDLDRGSTCNQGQDPTSNFMTRPTAPPSSVASSNFVLNHQKPSHGCRNGNATSAVCCNNNSSGNAKHTRRFNHQSSSMNSSIRKSGRRSAGGSSCHCKTGECTKSEDDVILFYSRHCTGAVEWAKYLHKLYTELSKHKGRLRVRHLPVEDMGDCVLPHHIEEEIYQSRIQIVLLSPTFLQFLSRCPTLPIGRLLHPDRVLAIMLGVKDSLITTEHRSVLVSFSQWIHLEAKDHDLEFVQTVLYFSTQILQRSDSKRVHRAGSICSNSSSSMNPSGRNLNGCRAESSLFSIQPKKLSEGQTRFMIVFENPQSSRCRFKVTLERHHMSGIMDVELTDARFKNPYNLQVCVPNCCFSESTLAGVRLEIDGVDRGSRTLKLESTMGELEQLLKISNDPIEFMCQSFAISPMSKDKIDEKLAQQFLLNSPKMGFSILRGTTVESQDPSYLQGLKETSCDFPTLLHFSAHHGLERLTAVLLECPGAVTANEMKNCSDMVPAELAQVNGNFDLAHRLQHFQKPQQTHREKHVYDYIHQHHDNSSRHVGNINTPPPLLRSNNIRSDYQVPPPPRPIEKISKESLHANKYVKMNNELPNNLEGIPSNESKSDTPMRQIRLPSLSVITSTLRLRSKERGDSSTAFDELLSHTKENKFKTPPKKNEKEGAKSPEYQVIQSPPHQTLLPPQKDPYGTMRASKRIGGRIIDAKNIAEDGSSPTNRASKNESVLEYDDDVFAPPNLVGNKAISLSLSTIPNDPSDPFGTLRANKAINNRVLRRRAEKAVMEEEMKFKEPLPMAVISHKEKHLVDYRGIPATNPDNGGFGLNSTIMNEDLVITDELLQLLEDFKTKSYSMKEMEMLFENWRRKAAIYESGNDKDEILSKTSQSSVAKDEMEKIKNKLRRLKASNTIIKFFKSSSNGNGKHFSASADEILNIRHTKDTQSFRKPSLTSDSETKFTPVEKDKFLEKRMSHEPVPMTGNQTIIEGEIGIFEEDEDINIVTFPPTPYKSRAAEEPLNCGISTQILPLSRLSMSSNSTSTPPNSSSSSPQETVTVNSKSKQPNKGIKAKYEDKTPKASKKHKDNKESFVSNINDGHQKISGGNESGVEIHDTSVSPLIVPNNTLSSNASIRNIITTTSSSGIMTESPQLSSTTPTGKKISPVRDKLDRLKKSLTDPLLHYFQISPECEEEPDLLNTPRSLVPPHLSTSNTISTTEVQNYGFIATEIDEFSQSTSSPVPKKLFIDESIKDADNLFANSSNDEGFSDIFKKEDSCEDNDENLPTPPPTPPPPIITNM